MEESTDLKLHWQAGEAETAKYGRYWLQKADVHGSILE